MNKYFMAKPTMHKLIMPKINMNEIIMAKIKKVKILAKITMVKLSMSKKIWLD